MTEPVRPIRLVLVDDHPAILDAVSGAVSATHDLTVIATARTFEAALARLTDPAAERPDVVLSDIQLAGEAEGLRLLERLTATVDPPPVLFLSSFDQPALLRAAFEKGAAGFVTKTAEVDEYPRGRADGRPWRDGVQCDGAPGSPYGAATAVRPRARGPRPGLRRREQR